MSQGTQGLAIGQADAHFAGAVFGGGYVFDVNVNAGGPKGPQLKLFGD